MKSSAALLIDVVDVHSVFEVDEGGNFVILRSHHQDVEVGEVSGVDVGTDFFQIPKKFHMPVERSVQDGSESLHILFVDPNLYFVFDVFLVQFLLSFEGAVDESDGVVDVEFEEVFFVAEAEVVEDGVALGVLVLAGVDGGVLFEVVLDFEDVGAAEDELGDVVLAFHDYR